MRRIILILVFLAILSVPTLAIEISDSEGWEFAIIQWDDYVHANITDSDYTSKQIVFKLQKKEEPQPGYKAWLKIYNTSYVEKIKRWKCDNEKCTKIEAGEDWISFGEAPYNATDKSFLIKQYVNPGTELPHYIKIKYYPEDLNIDNYNITFGNTTEITLQEVTDAYIIQNGELTIKFRTDDGVIEELYDNSSYDFANWIYTYDRGLYTITYDSQDRFAGAGVVIDGTVTCSLLENGEVRTIIYCSNTGDEAWWYFYQDAPYFDIRLDASADDMIYLSTNHIRPIGIDNTNQKFGWNNRSNSDADYRENSWYSVDYTGSSVTDAWIGIENQTGNRVFYYVSNRSFVEYGVGFYGTNQYTANAWNFDIGKDTGATCPNGCIKDRIILRTGIEKTDNASYIWNTTKPNYEGWRNNISIQETTGNAYLGNPTHFPPNNVQCEPTSTGLWYSSDLVCEFNISNSNRTNDPFIFYNISNFTNFNEVWVSNTTSDTTQPEIFGKAEYNQTHWNSVGLGTVQVIDREDNTSFYVVVRMTNVSQGKQRMFVSTNPYNFTGTFNTTDNNMLEKSTTYVPSANWTYNTSSTIWVDETHNKTKLIYFNQSWEFLYNERYFNITGFRVSDGATSSEFDEQVYSIYGGEINLGTNFIDLDNYTIATESNHTFWDDTFESAFVIEKTNLTLDNCGGLSLKGDYCFDSSTTAEDTMYKYRSLINDTDNVIDDSTIKYNISTSRLENWDLASISDFGINYTNSNVTLETEGTIITITIGNDFNISEGIWFVDINYTVPGGVGGGGAGPGGTPESKAKTIIIVGSANISIDKPTIILAVEPGGTVSSEIGIKNNQPNSITPTATCIELEGYEGFCDYVTIEPGISIPPGLFGDISFSVTVPKDIETGYFGKNYYFNMEVQVGELISLVSIQVFVGKVIGLVSRMFAGIAGTFDFFGLQIPNFVLIFIGILILIVIIYIITKIFRRNFKKGRKK